MKVGIMSMQRICNYGSFLQAYCLKNMIESLGHTVEFVDYKPGKPILDESYSKASYMKSKMRDLIMDTAVFLEPALFFLPQNFRHSLKFKRDYAKRYLPLLGMQKKNFNPDIDTLVIGSDEVFNCFQKNPKVGFSKDLFGHRSKANKIISYAASFGNTTYEEIEKKGLSAELSELFSKFSAISVRDQNSENIIKKLSNTTPSLNFDPVLMYDFSRDVPKFCTEENYIVIYAYRGRITQKEIAAIKSFAAKRGLKTVSVGGVQPFCNVCIDGSPFEIMDYIRKAEYVITDTFHGTVFSVINHKKFVSFVRGGHGKDYGNHEKLIDLLSRLELDSRAAPIDDFEYIIDTPIDYTRVDNIISEGRNNAMEYLKNNL